MSLSDALAAAAQKQHREWGCLVGKIIAELDDAEAKVFQRYLDDASIQHASIADALVAEGHVISHDTVSKHRRHKCRCDRP